MKISGNALGNIQAVVHRCSSKYRKTHVFESICSKVAGLRPATLLKMRHAHRCFPAKFTKFLRTVFFTEHLRRLLLEIVLAKSIIRIAAGF